MSSGTGLLLAGTDSQCVMQYLVTEVINRTGLFLTNKDSKIRLKVLTASIASDCTNFRITVSNPTQGTHYAVVMKKTERIPYTKVKL